VIVSNPVTKDNALNATEYYVVLQQLVLAEPYADWNGGNAAEYNTNNPISMMKPVTSYMIQAKSDGTYTPIASFDTNASKHANAMMQEQIMRLGQLRFDTTFRYINRQLLQGEDTTEAILKPNDKDRTASPPAWDKITLYTGEYRGNLYEIDISGQGINGYAFGGGVFINTSVPMFYARGQLIEAGVLEQPEIIRAVGFTDNIENRKYAYNAIYDGEDALWTTFQVMVGFVDPLGFVHRSAPSIPLHARGFHFSEIDYALDLSALVCFTQPLAVTSDNWFVEVYAAEYGSIPQLVYTKAFNPKDASRVNAGFEIAARYGDVQKTFPTRSSEFVYSDNFLSADPWEEFDHLVDVSRRIFFLRESTLYYTKLYEENTAPERNALLNIPFGRNKALTAIGAIDDKVIVFEADAIHAVYGDGPDNSGEGAPFIVDKLQTTVGCSSQESLVELPEGLVFYSDVTQEFHLLDRDFVVHDIGGPVQDLSRGITINSAVLYPAESEIRWYVTAAEQEEYGPDPSEDAGVPERPPRPRFQNVLPLFPVIVYNYDYGKWSVISSRGAEAVTVIGDKIVRCWSGTIWETSEDVIWGGSSRMKVRLPWIRVADMQNFGRIDKVVLLGKYLSSWTDEGNGLQAGDVQITTRYNYEANGNSHTYLWRANEHLAASNGERFQFSLKPGQPRCQAIQIEIEEVPTTKRDDNEPDYTTGQGFVISAVDLKCKLKRGFGDKSLAQPRSK
jgi:hypothetical protein